MNQIKNQHYISQIEQRLNCCNPNSKIKNQRILQFAVTSQTRHELRLVKADGIPISCNLAMLDLFTFDVGENVKLRLNFEQIFQLYENKVRSITEEVLKAKTSTEINEAQLFDLLVAKFINFVRNPFCIPKVINTFHALADVHPANQAIYKQYEKTLNGTQPHQKHICNELGISRDQYKTWLRLLFMLLTSMGDGGCNFLEKSLHNFLTNRNNIIKVEVHKYDTHHCLLSDRGFSEPIDQNQCFSMDFNLRKDAFIRLFCVDHNSVLGQQICPPSLRHHLSSEPKQINISIRENDLQALDTFHRRVIEQAYENVYCSSKDIHGVAIVA